MPRPTYLARRQRGLCPSCGRKYAPPRRWVCDLCRVRVERWRARKKTPMPLGERLRVKRESLGYTQCAFGNLLGITGDHVGGLERGTWPSPPSSALQQRLAEVLGCSVQALGVPEPVRVRPAPPSLALQEDLLRVLWGLPGGLQLKQCCAVISPRPERKAAHHAMQALCRQGLVQKVGPGRYARTRARPPS